MSAAEPETRDAALAIERAAAALASVVRAAADRAERERRLPRDIVESMIDGGIFRMCLPRSVGGFEFHPATMIGIIEELAAADGSAGWCAMIAATSGVVAAYLDAETAREIYGDPRAVSGGVYAPHGQALAVDDRYRVSGRWPFASGCEHCTWLMGACIVRNGAGPRLLPNGMPDSRLVLFPAADARIVDTWAVMGLQGTGSHDIEVTALDVPARRSVSLVSDPPRERGPLYAFPVFGLLATGIAAVALGIARHAVTELVMLAAGKRPTGSRRRLAERAVVQAQVAEAEALVGAAHAFLLDTVGRAWDTAAAENTMPLPVRAAVRLAATHATQSAARAVDLMYEAGGGTSVYRTSLLQRLFRDVHVVTQHIMTAQPTYELVGRLLLGLDTDTAML